VGYLSLDPMSRWAREQQGSIQYFRNDVSFLKTAIKPRDTIIFAEPNAGAIFLYSYDPNAFFHLTGTEIHRGFAYFRFPPHLNADNGSFANPVFVFCSYNRTASTIDAPLLFQMRKKSKKKGGSFWLVDMQYRRIPINLLFSILGISSKDCQLMAPGIILYKGM
jgi:hypothetical protein